MENGNQNMPDMQPPEDRANNAKRDVLRGVGKRIVDFKGRRRIIVVSSIILILVLIFILLFGFVMGVYGNQLGQAKTTPKTIYETLEVDDLYDLIEIKGDEKTGYYYDFKEGVEEKLDKLVKNLQRDGNKAITKDLLKKMIKAEVVNQFPFLQGTGGGSSISGNSVAEKVWNFMIENGYSEVATAGLMGNIHQESGGFNPAIVENGGSGEGIGLCQWSYGRRTRLENFARERGKDWSDVDIQLEYLLWELQNDGFNGNRTYQSQWENAETPEDAAIAFEYGFERAGIPMMENRTHWAKVYYEQFQGTYTAGGGASSNQITDLKGVLFIGDSITNGLGQSGEITEEGVIFKGVDNSTPAQWNNNTNSNFGQPTYSTLPDDSDDITALCVMIGTNNPWQITDTKELLSKLHNKYPNKTIFVQKLLPDASCVAQIDIFNNEIESYCNENSEYLRFIDSTEGVEISSDGTHPTSQGYKTLAENTKESIGDAGSSNYLGEFSGTIRIRRVTPNKNIGEVKNTGSGTVTDTTSNAVNSAVGTQIENYINSNATSGTWSVYAKNLTANSVKASINNQKLKSASLIKLFIMATAFEEIEKGVLNKNEVIDDIKIMINQSNNEATDRVIDKLGNGNTELGFSKINNYIKTNGYNATEIHRKMLEEPTNGDNYTSTMDVGNILEKMYRGTCVSQNASQEMIEILKTQTFTEKIPAGVPEGVTTANKTGELSDVENDAAIVYKDGAHYILVVMSNDVRDTAAARNNIKEISSKMYNLISSSSSSEGGTNNNATHKVAIVAGHGIPSYAGTYEQIANRTKWYTTGTSGKTPSGETWNEWQITKKVADYVEKYLSPYSSQVSVVQVGYSQANWERMQSAKNQGVDSYVGIHFNSSESSSANRSKCLL